MQRTNEEIRMIIQIQFRKISMSKIITSDFKIISA